MHPSNAKILPTSKASKSIGNKLGGWLRLHTSTSNVHTQNSNSNLAANDIKDVADATPAIAVVESDAEVQPHSLKQLKHRGLKHLELGNFEEGISDLTAAIDEEPSSASLYCARAQCLEKLNRIDDSISDYTQALSIEPENINAAYAKAACRNKKGDFKEAIEDYQYALQIDSQRQRCSVSTADEKKSLSFSDELLDGVNEDKKQALADKLHASGVQARKLGRFQDAIELYSQAIQIHSAHVHAHFNRAFAFDKLGQKIEAIDGYSDVLRIAPESALAYYNRGVVLDECGKIEQALQDFTKAIEMDHGSTPDFWYNRGVTSKKLGKLDQAIQDFTSAINLDPMHEQSLHSRGNTFMQQGKWLDAISDFSQALKKNPNSFHLHLNRGIAFDKTGETSLAFQDFDEGVRAFVTSGIKFDEGLATDDKAVAAALHNSRALMLEQQGQIVDAIADFTTALALLPTSAETYQNRGICRQRLGQFSAAVRDYTRAKKLCNPESHAKRVQVLIDRGFSRRKLGELNLAVKDFTDAIKLEPTNAKALTNRAYVFAQQNLFENAIADYTQCIKAHPNDGDTLFNRGVLLDRINRYRQAIDDFTRVIALHPENHNTALLNRAHAYEALGDTRRSVADFEAIDQQRSSSHEVK